MLDISVIIVANRENITKSIKSILKQNFPKDKYELILVSTKNYDESITQGIKYHIFNRNNPAFLRNMGGKLASGKILAFIDDDATAPKDWLKSAYNEFIDSNIAGIGGPNIAPLDVCFEERVSGIILSSSIGGGIKAFSKTTNSFIAIQGDLPLCNFFIRKDIFNSIGGFNPEIGFGGEDTEFIYIARQKGYKFKFVPSVFVYHHRRKFPIAYLKQRSKFRINTGLLFIAFPLMYMSNIKFCLFFTFTTLVLILSLFNPPFFVKMVLLYFILLTIYSVKYVKESLKLFLILPVAFFIHHAVYYIGTLFGVISVLWTYNNVLRIRKFRHNP